MKDTAQQIEAILNERYNGFRGTIFHPLQLHLKAVREIHGDEEFLKLMQLLEKRNPKPLYKLPDL